MASILLVEDDAMIASGLLYALRQEGYDAAHASGVAQAAELLRQNRFDLAILDLQLPDGTGFDVRAKLLGHTAVLFLTVVDDEGNLLRAFEGGAEDYVTKPFRLRELLARVKRALRSGADSAEAASTLTLGGATIDLTAGKAYLGGTPLELTATEYRLLLGLARHKGQILTRRQLLELLWDSAGSFVEDNTLSVTIKRLREKLGAQVHIETVRGLGYRANP